MIVEHAAGRIAARLGSALVAPMMAYVPEGPVNPPAGHMKLPGAITLPENVFMQVVEYAALSIRVHGLTDIVLIGDSGGNLDGLRRVALSLNEQWRETGVRVHFVKELTRGDVFRDWLRSRGESDRQIGHHAGIMDTSVAMAVDPRMVRRDRLAPSTDFHSVPGPARRTTAEPNITAGVVLSPDHDNALRYRYHWVSLTRVITQVYFGSIAD